MAARHSPECAHQSLQPDQATDQAFDSRPAKCYGHSNICAAE
jgi:hypothetical protein